jgi:hypothetical protein
VRQIKIIKVNGYYNYDDQWIDSITAGSTWLEVDDAMFARLNEAIRWANDNHRSTWKYHIVCNVNEGEFDDIFTSAQQVVDKYEKEKARQEKATADARAKREATALARKQAQLAKLKKELEGSET